MKVNGSRLLGAEDRSGHGRSGACAQGPQRSPVTAGSRPRQHPLYVRASNSQEWTINRSHNSRGMNHKQPPKFRESEDEILLSSVSHYPALYNWRHEDFKSVKVKADIWDSIASSVGRDVETCKRRWKDVKDNYFKLKRQHKLSMCKWSLVGKLTFLDSAEPDRRTPITFKSEDAAGTSRSSFTPHTPEVMISEQDGDDTSSSLPRGAFSRKRRYEEASSDEAHTSTEGEDNDRRSYSRKEEDDVDLFMRSIALQMKKMRPAQVAQAKVRILTIVNELQFGQMRVTSIKERKD